MTSVFPSLSAQSREIPRTSLPPFHVALGSYHAPSCSTSLVSLVQIQIGDVSVNLRLSHTHHSSSLMEIQDQIGVQSHCYIRDAQTTTCSKPPRTSPVGFPSLPPAICNPMVLPTPGAEEPEVVSHHQPQSILIKSLGDVETAISRILPHINVKTYRWLRLTHPFHTVFQVEAADSQIFASVGPSDMKNLLRVEQLSLESEAALLTWIAESQPVYQETSPSSSFFPHLTSSSLSSESSVLDLDSARFLPPSSHHILDSSALSSSPSLPSSSSSPSSIQNSSSNRDSYYSHCHCHCQSSSFTYQTRSSTSRLHDDSAVTNNESSESIPYSFYSPITPSHLDPMKAHFCPSCNIPATSDSPKQYCCPPSISSCCNNNSCLHSMFPVLLFQGLPQPEVPLSKAYSIMRSPKGSVLFQLNPELKVTERPSVNFQIGAFIRKLADIESPTGKFGPVSDVLNGTLRPQSFCFSRMPDWASDSWETAFHQLLEGALRDGEDLMITLPFTSIRANVKRFLPLLRHVTKPSLVCIDAGLDTNTLVLREKEWTADSTPSSFNYSASKAKEKKNIMCCDRGMHPQQDPFGFTNLSTARTYASGVTVTGLVDWSMCFFGDPLFAEVLSNNPSAELLEGFNDSVSSTIDLEMEAAAIVASAPSAPLSNGLLAIFPSCWSPIVQDSQSAHVRLLLYECYHAVTRVTAQFMRPSANNFTVEMAARKRLMTAIAKLDTLDDRGVPLAVNREVQIESPQHTSLPTTRRYSSGKQSPAKLCRLMVDPIAKHEPI